MSKLNDDQFGGDYGDYHGHPGEPNPDLYNSMDDYLADHRRWSSKRASGKPYRDRDVGKLKERARQEEEPERQQHKEQQQRVTQGRKQIAAAGRALRKTQPRVPKPGKLKMPGGVKRRKIF